MNLQIYKKLTLGERRWQRDLFFILFPTVLWTLATFARPSVITPKCSLQPESCTKSSVLPVDQVSLGLEDGNADGYSFFTQNLSGVLAYTVPALWNTTRFTMGSITPLGALAATLTDWMIITQTVTWNGLLTEVSHLLSQRPRPFVYSSPTERGSDPAHYTSFYSGHTSFTAAANAALFFVLLSRGAPLLLLLISGVTFEVLVLATAYFRIMAGRHFFTDVVCGAIAGLVIASAIAFSHVASTRGRKRE